MNHKGYKYRAYPTKEQEKKLVEIGWKQNILFNRLVEVDEKHRAWSICQELEKDPLCPFNSPFINEKGKIIISYKDGKKSEKYKFPYKDYENQHPFYKPDVKKKGTDEVRGKIVFYEAVKFFRKNDEFFRSCSAELYRDGAIKNYKSAVENATRHGFGFPRYKKTRENLRINPFSASKNNKFFNWKNKTIQISSTLGEKPMQVAFIGHRQPRGEVKNATLSRTSDGKWWLSVMAEWKSDKTISHRNPKTSVGIDVGITSVLATSSGKIIHPSKSLNEKIQKLENKKILLQTKKSKKYEKNGKKVSNSQRKLQLRINKVQAKMDFLKENWKNKQILQLCKENETIVLEDLSIRNMSKSSKGTQDEPGKNVKQKSGLNRSLLKWGIYSMFLKMEHKQKAFGGFVLKVPPAYTSQTCSSCGHVSKENRDGKIFSCMSCGYKDDADINAAKNILKKCLTNPI